MQKLQNKFYLFIFWKIHKDFAHWYFYVVINLLFVLPILFWNCTEMYLKPRKYYNFGRKNSRRAWHVISTQELKNYCWEVESSRAYGCKLPKQFFPAVDYSFSQASRYSPVFVQRVVLARTTIAWSLVRKCEGIRQVALAVGSIAANPREFPERSGYKM